MKLEFLVTVIVKTAAKTDNPTKKEIEAMRKYLKKLMLDDLDWEQSPIALENVSIKAVASMAPASEFPD